jgi:hypothetical protein
VNSRNGLHSSFDHSARGDSADDVPLSSLSGSARTADTILASMSIAIVVFLEPGEPMTRTSFSYSCPRYAYSSR